MECAFGLLINRHSAIKRSKVPLQHSAMRTMLASVLSALNKHVHRMTNRHTTWSDLHLYYCMFSPSCILSCWPVCPVWSTGRWPSMTSAGIWSCGRSFCDQRKVWCPSTRRARRMSWRCPGTSRPAQTGQRGPPLSCFGQLWARWSRALWEPSCNEKRTHKQFVIKAF